ncbi:MAG: hypothetical protein MUO31_06610 [Thermodesulfovibrionales bacterium]|nr:hypothetical protein [Thermodesulfovibrionales bacterium]
MEHTKLKIRDEIEPTSFYAIVDEETDGKKIYEEVSSLLMALRLVKCWNGWDELVEAGNEFIKTFTPHDIRSECFRAYTKLLKLLAAESKEVKE